MSFTRLTAYLEFLMGLEWDAFWSSFSGLGMNEGLFLRSGIASCQMTEDRRCPWWKVSWGKQQQNYLTWCLSHSEISKRQTDKNASNGIDRRISSHPLPFSTLAKDFWGSLPATKRTERSTKSASVSTNQLSVWLLFKSWITVRQRRFNQHSRPKEIHLLRPFAAPNLQRGFFPCNF